MKRLTSRFVFVLATLLVLGACKDRDAEKRIAELEARIAELAPTNTAATAAETKPETKPEGPIPAFEWSTVEHDFGTINEGDVVEHTYTFTNTGEVPLIIESAKPSCGCTVPTFSKEPIPVGGQGEIVVQFDSKGKPNIQNKTVTVTANTWPKVTTLRFKTFVTPASN